jgi:hypothetical protein
MLQLHVMALLKNGGMEREEAHNPKAKRARLWIK